jgi:hypothetical protein
VDLKETGSTAAPLTMFEDLADINPEALLADGFESAYLGYTVNQHHAVVAVYDAEGCIEVLMSRDGMDRDGAEEFLEFNTLSAWVGENGPLFLRPACPRRL